jgi:hypothetical protein
LNCDQNVTKTQMGAFVAAISCSNLEQNAKLCRRWDMAVLGYLLPLGTTSYVEMSVGAVQCWRVPTSM